MLCNFLRSFMIFVLKAKKMKNKQSSVIKTNHLPAEVVLYVIVIHILRRTSSIYEHQ